MTLNSVCKMCGKSLFTENNVINHGGNQHTLYLSNKFYGLLSFYSIEISSEKNLYLKYNDDKLFIF